MTVPFATELLAAALAAAAAFTDWRTGKIPNWLTLAPIAAAPLVWGLLYGLRGTGAALGGTLLCGLVPYLMFRRGVMHGGDVKLFAAIGAITTPHLLRWDFLAIEVELLSFIVASVFMLAKLAWAGKLLRMLGNTFWIAVNPFLPKDRRREIAPELLTMVRLGPSIFAATALALAMRRGLWSLP